MPYWIAFRSAQGAAYVEGPYETRDAAVVEREKAQCWIVPEAKCGGVFSAASREEAERRAELFVP